ncbi:MAG TPA: MATE family efflux transporter [Flavobacteriaceae bacterium]|nr:MATE family efflux transporter [Flavobacteriaceae bacterium]
MKQSSFLQTNKTLKLAYPVILGQLAQMILGVIDMAMVGSVGYKELAAAALVNNVINIPFVLGIGVTISVSQLVSMASGQRDKALVSHYLFNGFILAGVTAIIIALGLAFGKNILFHLRQDPEVATLAVPYLQLMSWSIIPMLLFMSLKQFTDGLEFTKTAMIISLTAIPINFFLNYIMIFGYLGFPRLELVGAGIGTLITRIFIFIALAMVVLRHKLFRRYIIIGKRQWYLNRKTWRDLLYIGIPSSLQVGMESGAFAVSAILIGTIGAREQAAHQIAISVVALTFMVSMGLSQAGSIRVSNSFGRKDLPLLRLIGKTTFITAVIYGTICAISLILLRNFIPLLFTQDTAVIEIAVTLLLFAAIFQISDSTQAVSSGLLRGIKDVRIPTLYIAIAYWVVGIPVGSLLTFYFQMGAIGIWIGFIVGLTTSAILLSLRFKNITKSDKILHSFNQRK